MLDREQNFHSDPDFIYQVNKANLMLLSSQPPRTVDVVFLHDRSFGDFINLFEMAARMYQSRVARFIATTNTDGARFGRNIPGEASYGKEWTIQHLIEQQIPRDSIYLPDIPSHHTREENTSFLDLSRKMGWRSGVILTQPHQLLRATLGMIYVMDQADYPMEIYTAAPPNTPWHEVVRVNQGIAEKPRIDNIDDEVLRIYLYQQRGDLATFEELFAYLEARERGSIRFTRDLPPDLQR